MMPTFCNTEPTPIQAENISHRFRAKSSNKNKSPETENTIK